MKLNNRHLLWLTVAFAGAGCLAAVVAAGALLLKAAGWFPENGGRAPQSNLEKAIKKWDQLTKQAKKDLDNVKQDLDDLSSQLDELRPLVTSDKPSPTPAPGDTPPTPAKAPP